MWHIHLVILGHPLRQSRAFQQLNLIALEVFLTLVGGEVGITIGIDHRGACFHHRGRPIDRYLTDGLGKTDDQRQEDRENQQPLSTQQNAQITAQVYRGLVELQMGRIAGQGSPGRS